MGQTLQLLREFFRSRRVDKAINIALDNLSVNPTKADAKLIVAIHEWAVESANELTREHFQRISKSAAAE